MFTKFKLMLTDSSLRGKLFFVVSALVVFRALAAIPIPGIDALKLQQFLAENQFLGLLNLLSGSGLSNLSLVMLGVGPYITASIIIQLLTVLVPKIKEMYQEDEIGRRKLTQYGRILTFPLAVVQGASLLAVLSRSGVIDPLSTTQWITNLLVVTAGTFLLMWIGELVTERGIGNGVSLIIFAGIVSRLPQSLGQFFYTFDQSQLPILLGFIAVGLLVLALVVYFTEAERPIEITYAKQVRGNRVFGGTSTYLPLRLTQAGVIPIIFALTVFSIPQVLAKVFALSTNATLLKISSEITSILANQWIYGIGYFILVFFFTYFYISVTFDPDMIANNLQKNGAFIPGIRPGKSTAEYIGNTLTKITFFGALFFGVVAVLPIVMQALTGVQALAVGGTALLIVVSVVLDLIKKIDAQLSMREY